MSNTGGRRVADMASVRVTVPIGTTVQQGEWALIGGWFGLCEAQPKTDTTVAQDIELTIDDDGEYESDQTTPADAFAFGDLVYFNAATRLLTTVAAGNRMVGRVSVAKDANGVIWFGLFDQRG